MQLKIELLILVTLTNLLQFVEASWCLGTGVGTCNLNIEGNPVIANGDYQYVETWTAVNIFDNQCNLIGYLNNPIQGVAIYSQLPYTVVLKSFKNASRNFTFCYAGKCYVNSFTFQEMDQDGYSVIDALHAFNCSDELSSSLESMTDG
ncbi:hypothetical protein PMAA_038610 [Talaromyces marneffei ATCC 18224]|uniref:Uncharacterized protein n=2 Tax=Talaromyces marneffei TaxID=37727 RepID=B6Q2Y1_TALMQ|nr:hypothetical protein PMAA_038610 [Talaromyces marneffei ATCC 18224]